MFGVFVRVCVSSNRGSDMTDRWRWEGASTIFSFWTENTDPFVLDCDSLKEKQGVMYRERKERTECDKVASFCAPTYTV